MTDEPHAEIRERSERSRMLVVASPGVSALAAELAVRSEITRTAA